MIQNLTSRSWRINNLYKIIDKNKQKIIFKPNEVQKHIEDNRINKNLILKARQFGVSTYCSVDCLDFTIFNENSTSAILAHKKDDVAKLFQIPRRAYDFLPEGFKPRLDRGGGSKYKMSFPELNSEIYCALELRGHTINRLHISEMAFMKNPDRVITTLQALPKDCIVTIETTPNGQNHFYDLWETTTDYKKFFFPWYFFGDYRIDIKCNLQLTEEEIELKKKAKRFYNISIDDSQIMFRRAKKEECKLGVEVKFEQEYPEDDKSCFLASGTKVFDLFKLDDKIIKLRKKKFELKKIYYHKDTNIKRDLEIYQPFKKEYNYVIGSDIAEGIESKTSDWSVFDVLRVDTFEQVAQLRTKVRPHVFASMLNEVAKYYSRAGRMPVLVGVERNNHGHAVLQELDITLMYPSLYIASDNKLGWLTSSITRPLMLDKFIKMFDNNQIGINSLHTLEEMKRFSDKNGKMQAESGGHDDTIMSMAIAIEMVYYYIENYQSYENISKGIYL